MTVKELRAMIADMPGDAPVLTYQVPDGFLHATPRIEQVFRSPSGGYGQFTETKLKERNNVTALVIQ